MGGDGTFGARCGALLGFIRVLNVVHAEKIQENWRKFKKIIILPYKIWKNRIFLNFVEFLTHANFITLKDA